MIDNMLLVDAVVHPWNMSPADQKLDAPDAIAAVHASHKLSVDAGQRWEAVAHAEFAESPVDLDLMHSLRDLGFGRSCVTGPAAAAACWTRHIGRFKSCGTVEEQPMQFHPSRC